VSSEGQNRPYTILKYAIIFLWGLRVKTIALSQDTKDSGRSAAGGLWYLKQECQPLHSVAEVRYDKVF